MANLRLSSRTLSLLKSLRTDEKSLDLLVLKLIIAHKDHKYLLMKLEPAKDYKRGIKKWKNKN